ncbi:MAG: MBL fold metallo-hydrolase RNA specificity domain-containing protein [Cytophagaceae bacterium]
MKEEVKLTFLGGAGTVTGSKALIETDEYKVLIDCGLFQGLKELRLKNWDDFPVDPATLDAVLLTHAHLDHVGYFPVLVKKGFRGKLFCTEPTRDIAFIILLDSGKIQEEEAELANRKGFSKHHPALALYTTSDVEKSLRQFEVKKEDEWCELFPDFKYRFRHSAHILGSAFIEVECKGKKLVFSGDIGRSDPMYLHHNARGGEADYLILESTYGNRIHPPTSPSDELAEIINDTLRKKGNLVIPSFTVERAQNLLVRINRLKKQNKIPNVPVFLDSPMAIDVTEVLLKYHDAHRLDDEEINDMREKVAMIRDIKSTWKVINAVQNKIIIAGSGMITGGRVLEYLKAWIGNPDNTVLLAGYQAAGTRGRALVEGAKEIKIHGQFYEVKAEIRNIGGLSGHGDQKELLDWVGEFKKLPNVIFLNHGEPDVSEVFKNKILETYALECETAEMNRVYYL